MVSLFAMFEFIYLPLYYTDIGVEGNKTQKLQEATHLRFYKSMYNFVHKLFVVLSQPRLHTSTYFLSQVCLELLVDAV